MENLNNTPYSDELNEVIEELKQSKLRFKYVTETAFDAIWDWDMITKVLYLGSGFKALFGHTLTEVKVNDKFWKYHIHPADQERIRASIKQAIDAPDKIHWEAEFLYAKADGTYTNVINSARIIRNSSGKPIRMIGAIKDIAPIKAYEAALAEITERFSYAARATSQTLWEWNAKNPKNFKAYGYLELFGYAFPGNIGQVGFWASKVHPEDIHRIWEELTAVIADRKQFCWKLEYRILMADDNYISIRDTATLHRDKEGNLLKIVGSVQDITRQKLEEQRLKLLESVITNSTDGVMITGLEIITDHGPRVIYVNEAFSKITGYTSEDMVGGSPRILYGPKTDKDELNRLWQAMENRESCETELIYYTKSGSEYWAQTVVFPAHDNVGNYSHFIGIVKDITARKQHEMENERLIKDLTRKIKDMRQFTYITSHNLRSPLTNILGLVSLTEDIEVADETLRIIHTAFKTTAESLIEIVNDLMDVLIRKENQMIKMEENVVPDVLSHILDQLISSTDDTRPIITCNFKETAVINFHKVYFESILSNILTNAIKYRSPVRRLHINITTHIVDNRIVLTFEDNGIGLDVERHKNRLFGFYQKFHDNPDSKGIGLYLVKLQMEELGGTVAIESVLNQGTKLILTFTK